MSRVMKQLQWNAMTMHEIRASRRGFLSGLGMGFGALAAGSLLSEPSPSSRAHAHEASMAASLRPRAKNVIWIFLSGGVSHLETFDPKPLLNKFAGKTYDETQLPNPQKLPIYLERSRSVVGFDREVISKIMPLQVGFRKCGASGIEVSDWLPHLRTVVDDLCIVRSMYTTDNDHNAEFQFHTGDIRWMSSSQRSVRGYRMVSDRLTRTCRVSCSWGSTRIRASNATSMRTTSDRRIVYRVIA